MSAVVDYLHDLLEAVVANRFEPTTAFDHVPAPAGVGVMFRAHGGRIVEGMVTFDEPVSSAVFGSMVERTIAARDDTARHLLVPPRARLLPHSPPSRVTLATPLTSAGQAISQAILVVPDYYSSPMGLVVGMVIDDEVTPFDLDANTPAKGPFKKVLTAADAYPVPVDERGYEWCGALWCDDVAARVGGPAHSSIWFGMPPHFVPIVAVGVDGMTDGFLWDQPESEPLDDKTLYRIAPDSGFALTGKRPFARHLTHQMFDAQHRAAVDGEAVAAIVAALRTGKSKPLEPKWPGKLKRRKPRSLAPGEAWLPLVNGDAVRVPASAVAPDHPTYQGDPWTEFDSASAMLAAGYPGSALWFAYGALARFSMRQEGAGIHAGYHAMIEPLEQLGRTVIAQRCREFIHVAAPLMTTAPTPPVRVQPTANPVWMAPMPTDRPSMDARAALDGGNTLDIDVDGATLSVPIERFVQLRPDRLPASTFVNLLDSGAVALSPDDSFVSEHGKPILAARVGDQLVVASVWEQPGVTGISLETIVTARDDERRLRPVRYVPFVPNGSRVERTDHHLLQFRQLPTEIKDAAWPFTVAGASFGSAGAHIDPASATLDVLTTPHLPLIHGLVVSERVAELITNGSAESLPRVPINAGATTIERRYVNVPTFPPIDWQMSSFVEVADTDDATISRHLGTGAITDVDAWRAGQNATDDVWLRLHVLVFASAPPLFAQPFGPDLVRLDIRDKLIEIGVTGCDFGDRSPFVLEHI